MRGIIAAELLLGVVGLYAAAGVLAAVAFAARGVTAMPPGDAGATLGARLLLMPAAAALWPLVVRRWRGAAKAR